LSDLRSAIEDVGTILEGLGCVRTELNFTLDQVPASTAHKAYTFGRLHGTPQYYANNTEDLAGTILPVLIAWQAKGDHNSTGTFNEGYLDAADFYITARTALVKNQSQNQDENNTVGDFDIAPLIVDIQDYILIQINVVLDIVDEM